MHYYHVYGMNIAAELLFPEMDEIPEPAEIDAEIIMERPPRWVIDEYREGKYSSIGEQIMWFRLYDEMLIYVEKSRASVWQIQEELDPIRLRSYILTGALTLLMFQRDYCIIHGSGIVRDGRAYLISGASGSGKSTTTLNLLKSGKYLFATDDICALRLTPEGCLLYPGPPFQKVCPDIRKKNEEGEYVFLSEAGGKYGKRLSEGVCSKPVPVAGMFVLSLSEGEEPHAEEVVGGAKLHMLTHNLFRGELLHVLGVTPQKVQQLLTVAGSFSIYSVERPQGRETAENVVKIIENIMESGN